MGHQLVICVSNLEYEASLEKWKIYPQVPDEQAISRGMIRVVDESGEDYLFPKTCFMTVNLPEQVMDMMLSKRA